MLMSMKIFHLPSGSCHGRRSSSSHFLVSSPATTMEFNSKFLNIHSCRGIQHSSGEPVRGSHATMKFCPVLFALPKENEEYPSGDEEIQELKEHSTLTLSDDVKEEQSKKLSSGEVKKLEFEVREATVLDEFGLDEFWNSVTLKVEVGSYEARAPGCCDIVEIVEQLDLTYTRYERRNERLFMCIIAVQKESEDVLNVIGTLDLYGEDHYLKKSARISDVAVSKGARRQGVASSMLKFAIESAKVTGIAHICIRVHRDNKPTLALLEKLGFSICAKGTLLDEQQNMLTCSIDL